jgi:hypothetical protein
MTTSNRHWVVGGDASRWYSLDAKGYMPADQSWLALGFVPSMAVDEAALWAAVADIDPSGIGSDNVAGQAAVTARTKLAIDAEREVRIALPLTVTLTAGTFQINMDAEGIRNLGGLSTVGILGKLAGSVTTVRFRDFANVPHDLGPDDLISMGLQAQARVSAAYTKSWAIKALVPIPTNYADDSFWS